MVKQQNNQPLNTRGVEYLIEYRKVLKDRVLALRAEACELAAKVREMDSIITEEKVQEVEEQKVADKAWSLNGSDGNNIMDLIANGK